MFGCTTVAWHAGHHSTERTNHDRHRQQLAADPKANLDS